MDQPEPKPCKICRAIAVTAFPDATDAAVEMLAAGGNAIDAAVAAAWALAVCEPSGSGLGGKAVMLLRLPSGQCVVIDGRSQAPAAATQKRIGRGQQKKGYLSSTVPTMAAVLGHAQGLYGMLPLPRVMEPAIRLAEDGYATTRLHRRQLKWRLTDLQATPAAAKLFLNHGKLFQVGEIIRQPALARTLRRLAEAGTEDFYSGEVAQKLVADMARHGGLITAQDLAECARPIECKPLSVGYRGHRVLSAPPPGGGLQLLLALKILERFGPGELRGAETQWYEVLARVIDAVFREREFWSITPQKLTPSLARWLLSGERAAEVYAAINAPQPGPPATKEESEGPGDTTHLCTADRQGNIVSLTQSIQSLFGAKVANEELGFLYNNCLCTCPRRKHPYQLASRCLPRSNAAPTILLKNPSAAGASSEGESGADGEPFLALGAAGSRRIVSSMLQVLSSVIDCGLSLAQAVARPRVHVTLGGRAHIEKTAATPELQERLARRFREVRVCAERSHFMGAVQAIQLGPEGYIGAADPRRDGSAAGV